MEEVKTGMARASGPEGLAFHERRLNWDRAARQKWSVGGAEARRCLSRRELGVAEGRRRASSSRVGVEERMISRPKGPDVSTSQ